MSVRRFFSFACCRYLPFRCDDAMYRFVLLTLLLVQQCKCFTISPGVGDPAPGRSPGPPDTGRNPSGMTTKYPVRQGDLTGISTPETGQKLTVDQQGTSNPAEVASSEVTTYGSASCYLKGKRLEGSKDQVNLTVQHGMFTSDILVPGITYQAIIQFKSSVDFTLRSSQHKVHFEGECAPQIYRNISLGPEWDVHFRIEPENWIGNFVLEVNFQEAGDPFVYSVTFRLPISQDCELHLKQSQSSLSSRDLPPHRSCLVWFPVHGQHHSLLVQLNRLNVACSRGFLHFFADDTTSEHRIGRLCGKLEELAESERTMYFAHAPVAVRVQGAPVFVLHYHLVDYCHNVTMTAQNGTVELRPQGALQCTFKIHLPWGNRVAIYLQIGDTTSTGSPSIDALYQPPDAYSECDGLLTQLFDTDNEWVHCTSAGDAQRTIEVVSRSNRVILRVGVRDGDAFSLRMRYKAEPDDDVVGACAFGSVTVKQFCVGVVEDVKLTWDQAESECGSRGGHLASVRGDRVQDVINKLVINSPGYRDSNAYWIGASDKMLEGDFRWSDGLPFSYTSWFPGWPQHNFYNRQPNDDGLSEQDCVEIRRTFSLPTSGSSLIPHLMWNDRDCSTTNYFICERLLNDEPLQENWLPDCNKTVELSRQQPRAVVSSPGFPRHYPDNADCDTDIAAPPGFRIVLDFDELVLENETNCSYDYLEIIESSSVVKKLCGDWSSKLKLLRYVSHGSRLKLRFSSDYSHHFGGYKARLSMESASQCADDRLHLFNNSCYLFVSYPEVTWSTAQQICKGKKGQLASIHTADEERFVTATLRKSLEYRTSALYWLGGKLNDSLHWTDNTELNYEGWLPGEKARSSEKTRCLAVQWTPSQTPMLPSGLYWRSHNCQSIGGYVCKKAAHNPNSNTNFNKTLNGSEGVLASPHHPDHYNNHVDFSVRISAPERTRIIIKFTKIDIEFQPECLYDFIELESISQTEKLGDSVRLCGTHDSEMTRFDFVSAKNEVELRFHSDYSVTGSGFVLSWKAVDISGCPSQTLTSREGSLATPNYPDFILPYLSCSVTILAPSSKRIWYHFDDFDVDNASTIQLTLGKEAFVFTPYKLPGLLTEGTFVSDENTLKVEVLTAKSSGRGFIAAYRTVPENPVERRVVQLECNSSGKLLHLNYPKSPPFGVDFEQVFVTSLGCKIAVELFHVRSADDQCEQETGLIEVKDTYSDFNGTSLKFCTDVDNLLPPLSILSFFNTLHLRQKSGLVGVALNGTLRTIPDLEFRSKLFRYREEEVEICEPNPCMNNGKCLNKGGRKYCQCVGHFTGIFCALTTCELEPCIFGTCQLTNTSYHCVCTAGYIGPTCDQKRRPCEGNPCESRGVCVERGDSFQCRCHAWWEGARCEKRMLHIPYKPLSERMFHEPFWLGLMTVFVVMAVIGLVWCAKKHFPEKIEKLLAEEQDRNRSNISSLRSSSVREQLAVASGAAAAMTSVAPSPGSGPPSGSRSLFGRLGIRKPSILSLTSPHASYGPGPSPQATGRTFSLDDLLRAPASSRRTPSPKKKRNNSTPTKKNAAEKKQILQQLISPGNQQSRKMHLADLLQMSDFALKPPAMEQAFRETPLVGEDASQALGDPKLEKKVTFARLLNKVSAEMSSGSEMELGHSRLTMRPLSTPPSPHSTSSNQGSDPDLGELLMGRPRMANGRPKPASADSILAMFRSFNLPPSVKVSPSTTPTASSEGLPYPSASSPMEECADDESSASSFASTAPGSPVLHRQIEVPVLDSLNLNTGSNLLHPPSILLEIPSSIGKCLSPIREMPTPLPSPMPTPAMTPLMRRSRASSEEKISVQIQDDDDEDADNERRKDIAIDPHAEDGLILEEAAAMQNRAKVRPPPLGQSFQPLVIPTLTVQTPSPTHSPTHNRPGSPPPHKSPDPFPYSQAPTTRSRRLLHKDPDKACSLELPCVPPLITITCNMSDGESEAECAASKTPCCSQPPMMGTMTYLSPFSMGTRAEQHASESNLSSSGYSSMASPGPSRCGSSNPLCLEMEDQGPGGGGGRPRGALSRTTSNGSDKGDKGDAVGPRSPRGRSDSETLSDDLLHESNDDEGIGTDHLDEKISDGDLKSAKELELFIVDSDKHLQLPSIVVQCDSPMSSRSESPLSDRTTIGKFSKHFYSNKDLPFTDSDGLYDFPSWDNVSSKRTRKKDKKTARRSSVNPAEHLDVPLKEIVLKVTPTRKLSPKRRVVRSHLMSSSSSSDSVVSTKEVKRSSSPETMKWTPVAWLDEKKTDIALGDKGVAVKVETGARTSKLSRLRAISHQIRFLRRLEMSLKRRERAISPCDSLESGGESPRATSPLLAKTPRVEIMKKSSSIGKLQCKTKRGKYKRGEALLQEEAESWRQIPANGHSD